MLHQFSWPKGFSGLIFVEAGERTEEESGSRIIQETKVGRGIK
jgi:hypothetical protein